MAFPYTIDGPDGSVKESSGLVRAATGAVDRMRPKWWPDATWPVKAGYGIGVATPVAITARMIQRSQEDVPPLRAPDMSFSGVHEGISDAKNVRNYGNTAYRIAGAVH